MAVAFYILSYLVTKVKKCNKLQFTLHLQLRNQQDSPKPTGTADSVSKDIESLKQTLMELQTEIASLRNE